MEFVGDICKKCNKAIDGACTPEGEYRCKTCGPVFSKDIRHVELSRMSFDDMLDMIRNSTPRGRKQNLGRA